MRTHTSVRLEMIVKMKVSSSLQGHNRLPIKRIRQEDMQTISFGLYVDTTMIRKQMLVKVTLIAVPIQVQVGGR